jgi:2-methylisocitrate lyase-like PEP mutase family enzyme
VIRANSYREAGADCLFVPGVKDADTIAALVKEVDGPVNVVMGLVDNLLTVNKLAELGVKRVSIGGSLARATFRLIRRAADEIRQDGTFKFADEQIPDDELCRFFSERMEKSSRNDT